ncbi:hypothetical protein [Streptomyces bobili]|uniref:hypothetical protein n=1 Tax=Streptomyces bobili TaxID=67280 RepID=UPI0037219EC9
MPHWYGGEFRTEAAVEQLRGCLNAMYEWDRKPIQATELVLTPQGVPHCGVTDEPSTTRSAGLLCACFQCLQASIAGKRVQKAASGAPPARTSAEPTPSFDAISPATHTVSLRHDRHN